MEETNQFKIFAGSKGEALAHRVCRSLFRWRVLCLFRRVRSWSVCLFGSADMS